MGFDFQIPAGEVKATASSTFTLQQVLRALQRESMKDDPDREIIELLSRERDKLLFQQQAYRI